MPRSATLLVVALALVAVPQTAQATRTLEEYRYFRALSIDLVGRIPSRAELTAFENGPFDFDQWIESHLTGPAYAERIRRIYTDLLRLGVSGFFPLSTESIILHKVIVRGPSGESIPVYFRMGQRRANAATDGSFCLTRAQAGIEVPLGGEAQGVRIPVSAEVLDHATRIVKPWWLYRDYAAASPHELHDGNWPGVVLAPSLRLAPDKSRITEIRVCAEEASSAINGTVYASGRTEPLRPGQFVPPPDTPYATRHAGQPIDCRSGTAFAYAANCGCGPGLEGCLPSDSAFSNGRGFLFSIRQPLGTDLPFEPTPQPASNWLRLSLDQEAVHFLDYILTNDRDFREVLTARYTLVNGPLAQYYRSGMADGKCCADGVALGYVEPERLIVRDHLPALAPHEVSRWELVPDRGPQASGLLTMPVYLAKAGTARARARLMWQAFRCREFTAGRIELTPSTETDLTRRPGCQICHATLDPLAAYFARIMPSSWTFLPADKFPVHSSVCKRTGKKELTPAECQMFYDAAFSDASSAMLNDAYAAPAHADLGPRGFATELTSSSEFAPCVAQNVASSLFGRALTSDDAPLAAQLAQAFARSGYRMSALVRALLHSDAYKRGNDLRSSAWRETAQ
jgi:hypothetical protein